MFLRIIIVLAGLVTGVVCQMVSFQCTTNQLEKCLIIVTLERNRNIPSTSTTDLMRHCRTIRENMNCILWYSTNCMIQSQRQLANDIIKNTRSYLTNICEDFDQVDENWLDNCFSHREIDNCKDEFSKQRNSNYRESDEDSCNRYNLFHQCVQHVTDAQCKQEHRLYLPTYLIDKAGHLSWTCSEQEQYFSGRDDQTAERLLKGAICVTKTREKLSDCRRSYDRRQYIRDTKDRYASACCTFNEYSYCVRNAVERKCGFEGQELTEKGLKRMHDMLGDTCEKYDFRDERCSSTSNVSSFCIIASAIIILVQISRNRII